MTKKILPLLFVFLIIFTSPLLVFAQDSNGVTTGCNTGKIIPEHTDPVSGKVISAAYENPCNFDALLGLINKVIAFLLITMATPLFALILIYVGWLYLSAQGSSENISKAKKIFKNAIIGYIIALAAWLIVKTILVSLGFTGPMFLA